MVLSCLLGARVVLAQQAGRLPEAGSATVGGATVVDLDNRVTTAGVLRLWQAYSSHGGRAMLKVFRPEGDRLVLVGTSALEAVPEGRVATFACTIPVARNDLVGVYCPDDNCLDRAADGRVLTAVGDLGTAATELFADGDGAPALFATASSLADIPSSASANLVVPVVARNPGDNQTRWTTALEIFNPAPEVATASLYLNLSGVDNTVPAASAQVMIPARGVVSFPDLVGDLFELEIAQGSVDIIASAPLLAQARIANVGAALGSYGQLVPALPAAWAPGDEDVPGANRNADILYLFEVREDDGWRSNLGVTNVSGVPLTVELAAFTGTAPAGQGLAVDLPPYSHRQLNRVLDALLVPRGTPGVRVNVSAAAGAEGRFLAYLSRVDNGTGDAVFQPGLREGVGGGDG